MIKHQILYNMRSFLKSFKQKFNKFYQCELKTFNKILGLSK